jgi:hypothetical protein
MHITSVRHSLLIGIHNCIFTSLIDSGADQSVIDIEIAHTLNITILSTKGDIELASASHTIPRIGVTPRVEFTPVIVMDGIQILPERSHSFEVLDLPNHKYQFVIGRDLIPSLFGKAIPTSLLCQENSNQTSTKLKSSITLASTSTTFMSSTISAQEGCGIIPNEEEPIRVSTHTSFKIEEMYKMKREEILGSPEIQTELKMNENITEFCNIPESVLRLKLDPVRGTPDKLYTRQYSIAHHLQIEADKVVKRWLDSGKIKPAPAGCPYNNPLMVAPKKDENGKMTGIRVCLDVRKLNSALIENDHFEIPLIRTVLNGLQGSSIFGELDLSEAYLQFKLHSDSQPLTAFTWQGKQYMFVGCPFGLLNMPSHFQRIISFVLSDMPFTMPYFDNIPFGSTSWNLHATHTLAIIQRLNHYNLRLKPSSVKIGQSELNCLGHRVTGEGIGISNEKLEKIREWPRPQTGKQLASFLGLITFVRHHVRHFADITANLESIKRTKGDIKWTPELTKSFELIRHAISRAPVLMFPDFNKPFYLATDASNVGIGGVLYQPSSPNDDVTSDNIVAICSKKLNDTQRRYSTYKKELYAIVYSLRQFHSYIWGHHELLIITDHMPLTHILTSTQLSQPLQQWLDVILDYHFKIKHRPGILHVLPDALSRMYESSYTSTWGIATPDIYNSAQESITDSNRSVSMSVTRGGEKSICIEIDNDTVNNRNCKKSFSLRSLSLPPLDPEEISPEETKQQIRLLIELERRGKKDPGNNEARIQLIEQEHLRGHFGRDSIFRKLYTEGYWWPGMRITIQEQIRECIPCMRHTISKRGFDPATPVTAALPFDHIQIDHAIKLPKSKDGLTAILVIVDVCTGFVILRALCNTQAETVADTLWHIFNIFGFPKILQSDNGPEFVNRIINRMMQQAGINHRRITPYHPRADGLVERAIGKVVSIIKKHLHGTKEHWPIFVPWAQSCINNKISEVTGSTPFSLMFGRKFHPYRDYTSDKPLDQMEETLWSQHQSDMMHIVYPSIAERVAAQKGKLVARLNKRNRSRDFKTGDIVMLLNPKADFNQPTGKFQPRYVGPFQIASKSRTGAITLLTSDGEPFPRLVRPHQLKFISASSKYLDDVLEVDHIIDHRGTVGNYSYLVRWKGFSKDDDTWEPESNFHTDEVIQDYWKRVGIDPTEDHLEEYDTDEV